MPRLSIDARAYVVCMIVVLPCAGCADPNRNDPHVHDQLDGWVRERANEALKAIGSDRRVRLQYSASHFVKESDFHQHTFWRFNRKTGREEIMYCFVCASKDADAPPFAIAVEWPSRRLLLRASCNSDDNIARLSPATRPSEAP